MDIKKFYSEDTTKKLWRQKITQFIKKNIPKNKIKDLKVLCLPGHEMLEVFEIYDSLGIKRNNIVGIEGNPFVFEELERKNNSLERKINVVNSSLKEYIKDNNKNRFDIISLDCTGYFNSEKSKILRLMSQGKMIGKNPIIITNYPIGKPNSYLQKNTLLLKKGFQNKNLTGIFKNKQNIDYSEDYDPVQDKIIQLNPVDCLLEGIGIWNSDLFKKWEKTKLNSLNIKNKERFKEIIRSLRNRDDYNDELINYLFFSEDNALLKNLNPLEFMNSLDPYVLKSHESYKYKSESKSILLTDFYYFEKGLSNKDYVREVLKISRLFPMKRSIISKNTKL